MQWISDHHATLSLALSAVSAVVWLVYLNLFLLSYLRQRKTIIVISRGVGSGDEARCFVSNMSAEPLFLVSVVADLQTPDGSFQTAITDRDEVRAQDISNASERTNQGPLKSGDFVDVGAFGALVKRAVAREPGLSAEAIQHLAITVVALAGHNAEAVGATRSFRVYHRDGVQTFVPATVSTRQLNNRRDRRTILRMQSDELQREIDGCQRAGPADGQG